MMANRHEEIEKRCHCPYCDAEIAEAAFPYCVACEVKVFYCPKCLEPIPRDKQVCPHCGVDIGRESAEGDE